MRINPNNNVNKLYNTPTARQNQPAVKYLENNDLLTFNSDKESTYIPNPPADSTEVDLNDGEENNNHSFKSFFTKLVNAIKEAIEVLKEIIDSSDDLFDDNIHIGFGKIDDAGNIKDSGGKGVIVKYTF